MALPTTGSFARKIENLQLGGGYNDTIDGGTDLDAAGNIAASGDMTIDGDLLVKGNIGATTIEGDLEVNGDLTLGVSGVNTTWSQWLSPKHGMWPDDTTPAAESLRVYQANSREAYIFTFADSIIERVAGTIALPEDYDGRSISMDLFWSPLTTNTGDIFWQLKEGVNTDGDDLTDALTIGTVSLVEAASGVIDQLKKSTLTFTPANGTDAAGQIMFFTLLRFASHANDTYIGSAELIGMKIHY